jgi:arylsulfatase A-like enzyme
MYRRVVVPHYRIELFRGRRVGLDEKTIVLITSDHGEEFFEHGNCDHVRFLYKEVVHVPFILRVPTLNPPSGRVRDVIPASVSIPRTLLDLTGLRHNMPGPSLEPILDGKTGVFEAVYSEANSIAGSLGSRGETIAMTTNRNKLISYLEDGVDEAYDSLHDPGEQRILPLGDEAYLARQTLRAWHRSVVPLPRSGRGADREEGDAAEEAGLLKRRARDEGGKDAAEDDKIPTDIEKQLKALGYLE